MNKKLFICLLSVLIFIGCNQTKIWNGDKDSSEYGVYIGTEKIDAHVYNNSWYVPLNEIESLDIDVKYEADKILINKSNFPKSLSNDRPYIWYIDQGSTGIYSAENCGPSTTIMASLWQNEDFDVTPEEARSAIRPDGGWWFTNDIKEFLDDYDISYKVADYDGYNEIIQTLNQGNIVVLCLDTSFLSYINDEDSLIGKFYYYSGGHFIIVKGYTHINNKLYYEVYDSNCWSEKYKDGSPKGKNRLYPADEIGIAIESWWDNYIIIKDN